MERSHETSMSTFPPFEMSPPNSVRASNSYTQIQIRCREGARYIYTVSFRGKGSKKAVLSSNLRTLDTQNKVRLISQPPQEIFFLLDLGDILLRGYDCLTIEMRFYIPSSSFQRNRPHFSFFFFKKNVSFVFLFSSFIVSSKSLRLTYYRIHFVSRCQWVATIDINNIDNIGTLSISIYYCISMWQSIFLL